MRRKLAVQQAILMERLVLQIHQRQRILEDLELPLELQWMSAPNFQNGCGRECAQ